MSFSGMNTYKAGSMSRTCAGLRGLNGASRKPPEESKGTQETEVQLAMHTISCQPFEITVQDKDSKVHTLKFAAPILVPASGLQTTEEEPAPSTRAAKQIFRLRCCEEQESFPNNAESSLNSEIRKTRVVSTSAAQQELPQAIRTIAAC